MRKGHTANDCNGAQKCTNCQRNHHSSICERDKVSQTEDETKATMPSLHIGAQGKVALQTSTKKGPKVRYRILLDFGSCKRPLTQDSRDRNGALKRSIKTSKSTNDEHKNLDKTGTKIFSTDVRRLHWQKCYRVSLP